MRSNEQRTKQPPHCTRAVQEIASRRHASRGLAYLLAMTG